MSIVLKDLSIVPSCVSNRLLLLPELLAPQQGTELNRFAVMQIFVKTFSGRLIVVDVEHHTTVRQVKATIAERDGCPRTLIRLIFLGKMMDDERDLASYGVQREATLVIGIACERPAEREVREIKKRRIEQREKEREHQERLELEEARRADELRRERERAEREERRRQEHEERTQLRLRFAEYAALSEPSDLQLAQFISFAEVLSATSDGVNANSFTALPRINVVPEYRSEPEASRLMSRERAPAVGFVSLELLAAEGQEACVVCSARFEPGEVVTTLPCRTHGCRGVFHRGGDCGGMARWLEEQTTCPLCRGQV